MQSTNCHPFRHSNWLWMHSGLFVGFAAIKRDLVFAVDPSRYPLIQGSTDSEVFFLLARTFGLQADPVAAVARAVGVIEKIGRGLSFPSFWAISQGFGGRVPEASVGIVRAGDDALLPFRPVYG